MESPVSDLVTLDERHGGWRRGQPIDPSGIARGFWSFGVEPKVMGVGRAQPMLRVEGVTSRVDSEASDGVTPLVP